MLHQLEFIFFFIFSIVICFTKNANTISNERRINNRAQILKTTSFVIKNQRKLLRDSRTPMNFDNDAGIFRADPEYIQFQAYIRVN